MLCFSLCEDWWKKLVLTLLQRFGTLAIQRHIFRRSSAVEQLTVNQLAVGSIPTAGAKHPSRSGVPFGERCERHSGVAQR